MFAWNARFVCHAIAAGFGLLAGGQALAQGSQPPPAVTVAPVVVRQVADSSDFIGRVTPIDRVEIVARVAGFIEQRFFTEGEIVKAGDLLFRIEQATYKAAVQQAEANLAKAKAVEVNAAVQLQRGKALLPKEFIPQATVDQRAADEATAQANILDAQAALTQAQINLGYTEIHSPITGRIGLTRLTVGNLVGPSTGSLTTVVSLDPIYVIFQASEREVLDYRRRILEQGNKDNPVAVRVRLADGSLYAQPGVTNFLDIQVEGSTDTVAVRAQFPNPQGLLVPGGVVNVTVEKGPPKSMLLVPEDAIQLDQAGRYVLVVDDAKKVALRRVSTGAEQGSDIVVTEGLKPGEQVIVEGIQKVRPGQIVAASPAPGN